MKLFRILLLLLLPFASACQQNEWVAGLKVTEFDYPHGVTPALELKATKFIAVTDGTSADNDGWFGRPSMVVRWSAIENKYIVICWYKEGAGHHLEGTAIIHQIMSADFGETWSDPNKDLHGNNIVGMPMRPANAGTPFGNDKGPSHGIGTLTSTGRILMHMWSSDYDADVSTAHNDGGHQAYSDDGGLTWSTPARKSVTGYTGQTNTSFWGEGRTVVGDTIYYVMRDYRASPLGWEAQYLLISTDDGETWSQRSQISTSTTPGGHGSGEVSLEYLGNGRFIALMRPAGYGSCCVADYKDGWITSSTDYGRTWATPFDITAQLGLPDNFIIGRTIVRTRAHLRLQDEWWKDRVIIVCGFTSEQGSSAGSRRNVSWTGIIPENYDFHNIQWSAPMYPDVAGFDGGYGDFFWNRLKNQIVFMSYRSPSSLYDASVKQYNISSNMLENSIPFFIIPLWIRRKKDEDEQEYKQAA